MSISEIFLTGGAYGVQKMTDEQEESGFPWIKIGIAFVIVAVIVYFVVSKSSATQEVIPSVATIPTLSNAVINATLPKQSAFSEAASKMLSTFNNNGLIANAQAAAQANVQSINNSISQALGAALIAPDSGLPTTPSAIVAR